MAIAAHDPASLSLSSGLDHPVDGNLVLDVLARADVLAHPALRRLGETLEPVPAGRPAWSRAELAGRLCELSAGQDGALLSTAVGLVVDAQRDGEPVHGSAPRGRSSARCGGLRCGRRRWLSCWQALLAGRAAVGLLRWGGFGLVVLDLGTSAAMPTPLQGRLVQLALKHDAAVVCLTDKQPGESSLGSLVSLRGQAVRRRSRDGRRFTCEITTLKDKRRGPGWTWREVRHGPEGLS
jgi:recombination protein RecA